MLGVVAVLATPTTASSSAHDHNHGHSEVSLFPTCQYSHAMFLGFCGSCVGLLGWKFCVDCISEGCECTFICHVVIYFTCSYVLLNHHFVHNQEICIHLAEQDMNFIALE